MNKWLGIDVGGANIKVADGCGFAASRSFPLWQKPDKLAHEIRSLIADAPACDRIAATMTGELADCYETKREGVESIVAAIEKASDGKHTRIYLTNGKLVTPEIARREPLLAAASNWHALATFACSYLGDCKNGMLIDIGSTTTDLIPLSSDGPTAKGATDTERLEHGELVYTGVRRNPVCSVVREVPYRDLLIPVAGELFATMLDVYIIMGDLAEDPASRATADSRPATKGGSRARLARMICADSDIFNHRDAVQIAKHVADEHLQMIVGRAKVAWTETSPPEKIILGGSGESISAAVAKALGWTNTVSLRQELNAKVSTCGPAHAVAVIASGKASVDRSSSESGENGS